VSHSAPLFIRSLLILNLAAIVVVSQAGAREYAPRVVSPHHADAYSLKTFAQFPRWRDLRGDRRAWEIFQYLADRRTGLFPLGKEVLEGRDVLAEFQTVRDPVKLINVYGYGYCGILGPTMAGVCEGTGIGKARTLIIPGWGHVAAETFYDGKWHYLDLDVRAAFRRADGSLAAMADAQRDASLWQGQGPLFFPLDPLERTRDIYQKTAVHHYNGFHYGGHTMDFVLRQGETLTRWWQPQDGRWHHVASYHEAPFHKQLLERSPRGPKCKHAAWTVHSHGNGRFVYQPNLTDRSSDFVDGASEAVNVVPGAAGLTLREPGQGHAVFEVRSPYVIVPLVDRMETRTDDREASVVEVDALGASLSLSLDNGLTWTNLGSGQGTLDLTAYVSGTYGYLLKISLKGEPGRAVVRSLRMTTWVQVAPASLPGLRQGTNRMEYRTGDHYGLASRVVEIRTNGSDRADVLKYLHEAPKDFDPQRKTARIKGPFVVKVQAPPGSRIAWLSAGGNFSTHQQAAARNTRNAMALAVNEPKEFQPFYQAKVPTDQGHWHDNADREIKLPAPAKVIYLRYVGDPGVNNLRIYAHCVDDCPRTGSPVTIRQAWREGGVLKTHSVTLAKPGSYEIVTGADPVDEYLEMAIPSDGKPG
jgi:hypothetical protein